MNVIEWDRGQTTMKEEIGRKCNQTSNKIWNSKSGNNIYLEFEVNCRALHVIFLGTTTYDFKVEMRKLWFIEPGMQETQENLKWTFHFENIPKFQSTLSLNWRDDWC